MRFKITFSKVGNKKLLPVNYQYYISAWIYNIIASADNVFADFLHNEGYREGSKNFKFFNYSSLDFGRVVLRKEKNLFEIKQDQISLNVSFYLSDAAEAFILGLFRNQEVYLGDSFSGLDLRVAQIERLPETDFVENMHYRALSPVVISFKYPESSYASYLSPDDKEYARLFLNNLKNKYNAVPKSVPLPDSYPFRFSLAGLTRSKLVTIKQGTPEQSKIRGYLFEFELTAPPELHRLMLACGAGEKNALGFGWCEDGKSEKKEIISN